MIYVYRNGIQIGRAALEFSNPQEPPLGTGVFTMFVDANPAGASEPGGDGPSANEPSANAPSANTPSANTPSANAPSANAPSANVLSAEEPGAILEKPVRRWMAVDLPSQTGTPQGVELFRRVRLPTEFARYVNEILQSGTTLMVTDLPTTKQKKAAARDFLVMTAVPK